MSINRIRRHICSGKPRQTSNLSLSGDLFSASVINQKTINQNAQQILVVTSIQNLFLTEAQFGFSTNADLDIIDT